MIRARVKDGALYIISATELSKELAPFEGREVEITVREVAPAAPGPLGTCFGFEKPHGKTVDCLGWKATA